MYSIRQLDPYRADMPLAALCTAEIFLAASIRLWNTDEFDPAVQMPRWRSGFAHARIGVPGVLAFDRFCRMVAIGADRAAQVRGFNCSCVSDDETLLLRTIGYLQHERTDAAAGALGRLCPTATVRLAIGPAQCVATALLARRLRLPLRLETRSALRPSRWDSRADLGRAH